MPLVGNDVIDLTDPAKAGKSRDARFIGRVFTSGERDRILNASDPDETLWTLWAGKEAAYKVMMKRDPRVCSIPRAYAVVLDGCGDPPFRSGFVATPAGTVRIRVIRKDGALHVIGMSSEPERPDDIAAGIEAADAPDGDPPPAVDRESFLVRAALLRHLPDVLKGNPGELEIRRLKAGRGLGPPRLYVRGEPSDLDISMSHDGRFVAWAFSRAQQAVDRERIPQGSANVHPSTPPSSGLARLASERPVSRTGQVFEQPEE